MALALVICDVWDTHWCATARRQADELAPRINDFAGVVRRSSGVVIHAPSQTDSFYDDWGQRVRARQSAAQVPDVRPRPTVDVPTYHSCPCQPSCTAPDPMGERSWPWRRQHPAIDVAAEDFIACEDADVVYGIATRLSSRRVALCGLHLDQCILDRPFGAKGLWSAGLDVVICEDLTEPTHPEKRADILRAITRVLPVQPSMELLSN